MSSDRSLVLSLLAALASVCLVLTSSFADCPEGFGDLDPDPNVTWTFKDSIAACPAGDSLVFGTNPNKPSQLRIVISYADDNCDPKVGVPPESIYVLASTHAGNAKVNDQPKVYADDSTNASGQARVTIRSMSGAGKLKIRIFVSGVEQGGYSTPTVRTTDTDADGRVTEDDATGLADLNYDGDVGFPELGVLAASLEHWRRHALFGTPVRRTNLTGNYGQGRIDWEPNQNRVAYSAHLDEFEYRCRILHVPSDPAGGNQSTLFTWDGADSNDYNPSWSPRGHEIAFDRNDKVIYRKGLPGSADTTKAPVVIVGQESERVTIPAFSPNGRKIAYVRIVTTTPSHSNIYTVDLPSGTPQQLTRSTSSTDLNPRWSPDGEWIYFSRREGVGQTALWRVKADGTDSTEVYAPSGIDATLPALSPDGKVIVAQREGQTSGYGITHTLETEVSNPVAVPNYGSFATQASLYQVPSPDGTRLAFLATPVGGGYEQLWAVRRNMDRPPTLTSIGDRVVEQGTNLSFTVSASDPESDPITRSAHFLASGMSFTPSSGAFSWTPGSGTAGNSYWVKFMATVPSGGTASEVVKISVIEPGLRGLPLASAPGKIVASANPSSGPFLIMAPESWASLVELRIFDARGRLVGRERGKAGLPMAWNGRDLAGAPASPGVYFYELRAPHQSQRGKWVLIR